MDATGDTLRSFLLTNDLARATGRIGLGCCWAHEADGVLGLHVRGSAGQAVQSIVQELLADETAACDVLAGLCVLLLGPVFARHRVAAVLAGVVERR